MGDPFKKAGFRQPLFAQSATAKEKIGRVRVTDNGRVFRYSKAGSSALAAGKLNVAVAIAANVTNQGATAAVAIGTRNLTFTAGGAVTYALDYFKGGYLQVNDATGEGHQYEIEGSSAVTAGTTIYITLAEPIRVALVATTSELTLVHNPCMAVAESATQGSVPVGIPPIAVSASYYFWNQCWGPAIALMVGTPAIGSRLTIGSPAGSLKVQATAYVQPHVAEVGATAGVNTEYKPVNLKIGW